MFTPFVHFQASLHLHFSSLVMQNYHLVKCNHFFPPSLTLLKVCIIYHRYIYIYICMYKKHAQKVMFKLTIIRWPHKPWFYQCTSETADLQNFCCQHFLRLGWRRFCTALSHSLHQVQTGRTPGTGGHSTASRLLCHIRTSFPHSLPSPATQVKKNIKYRWSFHSTKAPVPHSDLFSPL